MAAFRTAKEPDGMGFMYPVAAADVFVTTAATAPSEPGSLVGEALAWCSRSLSVMVPAVVGERWRGECGESR
jgi:hypothetical protein